MGQDDDLMPEYKWNREATIFWAKAIIYFLNIIVIILLLYILFYFMRH